MKLSRAQRIEYFARSIVAENKHDSEYMCQTRGPEKCGHCFAIRELRKLLEQDVNAK